MNFNKAEFLNETEVPYDELIVSRTSLDGIITYANDTFIEISGYTKDELIGQHHNIVRHPDMPRVCFEELWSTIKEENKWIGNVKNLRKDGGYYWVKATVSGVYKDGILVEYKSIRVPISSEEKIQTLKKYDELKIQTNDKQRHIIYK